MLRADEFVSAGVVDENVQPAERPWFPQTGAGVGLLGNVGLHRLGLPALAGDFGDDAVGPGFAGGEVDNYRAPSSARCLAMAAPIPWTRR